MVIQEKQKEAIRNNIPTSIIIYKRDSSSQGGRLIQIQTKSKLEGNFSISLNTSSSTIDSRKTHTKVTKRKLGRSITQGNSALLKYKSLILLALISLLIFGRVSCDGDNETGLSQEIQDAINVGMMTIKEDLVTKFTKTINQKINKKTIEMEASLEESMDGKLVAVKDSIMTEITANFQESLTAQIKTSIQDSMDENLTPLRSSFLEQQYDIFVKNNCYVTENKYESISHNMDRGGAGHWTSFAFKNKNTWVATKHNIGLTLFKDGVLVYDKPLPHGSGVRDSVYINDHFYIAAYEQRLIYKKSIDAHEPVAWVTNIQMNDWGGKSLQASPTQNALIVNQALTNIIAISLADSTKRFTIFTGKEIRSHIVFGKKKNFVAISTRSGALYVYRFSMKKMQSWFIASLQIPLIGGRDEGISGMVVDKTNTYINLILNRNAHDWRSSRVFMIEFNRSKKLLSIKNSIDLWESGLQIIHALEFYGHFGNHLILAGIDYHWHNFAVFDFNTKYGTFDEIKRMRRKVDSYETWSLKKIDGELKAVGYAGKMTTIKFSKFQ